MDQTSEPKATEEIVPAVGDKPTASPRPKQVQLLRPESVDMCASVASLDIQLATPMCHLSTPTSINPLFQRALSDSGERRRKVLHKALSTEVMVTVDEGGEELQNYPLKKRRTSVSMQHIPSSSLLKKELGDPDAHGEKIEEEDKKTDANKSESQCKNVPSNPESYVENTTGIDESQNEETAMLKVKNDVTVDRNAATMPQVSIVISGADDKQRGGKEDDVEIKDTAKKSGCLEKIQTLLIVKLWR